MLKNIWEICKNAWMKFAHILGYINTRIILSVLFFIIFGVYAICLKLLNGIKFVFIKKQNVDSYWEKTEDKIPSLENCKNQEYFDVLKLCLQRASLFQWVLPKLGSRVHYSTVLFICLKNNGGGCKSVVR